MLVFDDEHFACWKRSKKQALANLGDDKRVCVMYPNFKAQRDGCLNPASWLYGPANCTRPDRCGGNLKRLNKREQEHQGADKGIGVMIKISLAADVRGKPLL